MMTSFGPTVVSVQESVHTAQLNRQFITDDVLARGVMRFRRLSESLPYAPLSKKRTASQTTRTHHSHLSHDLSTIQASTSNATPLPFLKELFISPHPDDICYSCFGTAVKKEGSSSNTHNGRMIVTVFSQSRCCNGHLADKLAGKVDDITSVRKEEDESFAKSVNCKLLQLGLSDSSARDEFSRREELAMQTKEEMNNATKSHPSYSKVQSALNDVIRWAVKCKAAIYMPLGIGCHIDHMMTRVATESIMEEIRRESPTKTLPNKVTYYEDLPYAFYQTEETIERMANTIVVGNAETHLEPLDANLWTRKTMAVQGYATQMKPTIIPSLETRALLLGSNQCHTEDDGPQRRERTWILAPGEWRA